jgi:hypothetical protein
VITLMLLTTLIQGPAAGEWGPAVGQPLPAFEAPDQDGRPRSFGDLHGPKGLVLLFFRSADW